MKSKKDPVSLLFSKYENSEEKISDNSTCIRFCLDRLALTNYSNLKDQEEVIDEKVISCRV